MISSYRGRASTRPAMEEIERFSVSRSRVFASRLPKVEASRFGPCLEYGPWRAQELSSLAPATGARRLLAAW